MLEVGPEDDGDDEDENDGEDKGEDPRPKKKVKYDQHYLPCHRLQNLFGFRYALLHLGAWLATGHPYSMPVVSGDYMKIRLLESVPTHPGSRTSHGKTLHHIGGIQLSRVGRFPRFCRPARPFFP